MNEEMDDNMWMTKQQLFKEMQMFNPTNEKPITPTQNGSVHHQEDADRHNRESESEDNDINEQGSGNESKSMSSADTQVDDSTTSH